MNVDLFKFQIVSVSAGFKRILVHWFRFIENLLITGQNVETIVDILGDILQNSRGVIGLNMDIDGRVPGLSVGSVGPVLQGQSDIEKVYDLLIGRYLDAEPEPGEDLTDLLLNSLGLERGESAEHASINQLFYLANN